MRVRLILGTLGVTALALLSTAGTRIVQAANRDVDVNCADMGEFTWFVHSGDTVTFNLASNCGWYLVKDADDLTVGTGVPPASVTLSEGMFASFAQTVTDPTHDNWVTLLAPEHVPAGVLNVTAPVVIPAVAPELDLSSDSSGTGDHYVGGTDTDCAVSAGLHVYSTVPVTIDEAGTFTFRAVESDPVSSAVDPYAAFGPVMDPMMALYSSFDPAHPDDGVLGCNDDIATIFTYTAGQVAEDLSGGRIMDGVFPYFTADLQPGTYTLVLLTYTNVSADEWVAGDSNGMTFTPGAESVTFEMWGPQGSVCTTACTPIILPDVLPPTGADSTSALFAAAAVMFGGALVIGARRRRISAR